MRGLPTPQTPFDVALLTVLQQQFVPPAGSARPLLPQLGQTWFDTGIGKPIWWNGVHWVNADGAVV